MSCITWFIGRLEESFNETSKNETIEQKRRFLCLLLGTLGISLLGDLLVGKGVKDKISGQ